MKTDKIYNVARWATRQENWLDETYHYDITVNALRNVLFDLPPIYSGYTSREAINRGYTKSQMTVEHYNARQRMARRIMKLIDEGAPFVEVYDEIEEACRVHYTTKEENMALVPYQRKPDYVWKEAYASCGIELVLHDPTLKKFVINGKVVEAHSKKILVEELSNREGISKFKAGKLVKRLE